MKWLLVPALSLASCNAPEGNATATENAPAATAAAAKPSCALPRLEYRHTQLKPAEQATFNANFRTAFDRACAEGLLADGPLVDPGALDKDTIVVMNAPEANVTSIYFGPSAAPPAMLLESPLGSPPQIPSAEDLHEAIYCAVKGATPEEEETTGRCLPD